MEPVEHEKNSGAGVVFLFTKHLLDTLVLQPQHCYG